MSKVDWITWKTDTTEIINPNIIESKLNDKFQDYNSYMNPVVYEQIKYEMSKGGLDRNSFNVSDSFPANELAVEIIDLIEDTKKTFNNLVIEITKESEEQKQIEKRQLIKSIEDKIKQEEENINNYNKLKENVSQEEYTEIINERIKILKNKLESAKSL